jgi:DNA-binding XRE family transcriptional regulator
LGSSEEIRIGERLRFYRQGRGKTQVVVAGLAGVSEEYVSQIERGLKTPTITVLHRFARILGVPVGVLLGEPDVERDGVVHPIASAVNRAMMTYSPAATGPVDLVSLRERVDAAWGIWQGAHNRYTDASAVLPELIGDVQQAARSFRGPGEVTERREAARLSADMHFLLRTFTKRIGRTDLSLLAADRAMAAAEEADDPLRIAAAQWNLGHILLAQDESEAAEEISLRAAETLKPRLNDGTDWIAMYGALWLVAVIASVRSGDSWTARDRIREHAWPAARKAGEGNALWTVFGPTNVAMHAMSVEMEAGEAAAGLRLADDIDVSAAPSLERQMTFYLEVARLYDQRRDDPGVLLHLVSAETAGPEDLRYNLLARDLVRGLLKRARPSFAPQVRTLAERIGLGTA